MLQLVRGRDCSPALTASGPATSGEGGWDGIYPHLINGDTAGEGHLMLSDPIRWSIGSALLCCPAGPIFRISADGKGEYQLPSPQNVVVAKEKGIFPLRSPPYDRYSFMASFIPLSHSQGKLTCTSASRVSPTVLRSRACFPEFYSC